MNYTTEQRAQDAALNYDGGKLRFDLIPVEPLKGVADVFTYGATKYADRNWEKGMRLSRHQASLLRHIFAFCGGEDIDPESGKHHLDLAATRCMMMREQQLRKPELDDRPYIGGVLNPIYLRFAEIDEQLTAVAKKGDQ